MKKSKRKKNQSRFLYISFTFLVFDFFYHEFILFQTITFIKSSMSLHTHRQADVYHKMMLHKNYI